MRSFIPVLAFFYFLFLLTTGAEAKKTVVELAQGTNSLSTLVAALKAGNLVTALQGKGPFTVFAPSNTAFAKLPKATLASLLEPKNKDKLVSILTYHVVSGAAVYSKDLKATQKVKTLEGQDVLVQSPSINQMIVDMLRAIRMGVPIWFVLMLVFIGNLQEIAVALFCVTNAHYLNE